MIRNAFHSHLPLVFPQQRTQDAKYTHMCTITFGFVRAALLPAVGTCVVLAFAAMPGRCCFLRVTLTITSMLTWHSGMHLHDAYTTPWVVPNEVANQCCER